MQKFGVTSLITLLFFSSVIISCFQEDFDESCDTLPYFRIEGIDAYNFKVDPESANFSTFTSDEAISWTELALQFEYSTSYYTSIESNGSLMALSCLPNGFAGSQDKLASIHLITLNDYNQFYEANDTINSIITMDLVKEGELNKVSVDEYVSANSSKITKPSFLAYLNESPEVSGETHQFKLVFVLMDGQTFDTVTDPAILTY